MSRQLSEREFIERIRARLPVAAGRIVKAIGDDCAVLRGPADCLQLLTVDTLVEGIHFERSWHPAELVGRKAAAVNISDIAAMGGTPHTALLSVAVPDRLENGWLDRFMDGFLAGLAAHEVVLVGGDTVKANYELSLSVTLLGEVAAKEILYRQGAKPGDLVWLSSVPGRAAAGLALCRAGRHTEPGWQTLVAAHLDPQPEVELGRLLAVSGLVSAMMDSSDGIATDLAHLCKESGVGAEILAADLPASAELTAAAAMLGGDLRHWALKGGEDFCLLFTSPAEHRQALTALVGQHLARQLSCVGRITESPGVFLVDGDQRQEITYQGYDHFRS